MRMLRCFIQLGVAAALLSLLGGCEVAPHQPQPAPYPAVIYPSPPPDYAYEELRRCHADNRRAHAEVIALYERARSAGRISAAEAQQFSEMDTRLRIIAGQLQRDGLTLPECQYISTMLANNRNEVLRMSRRDPALARCIADNQLAHQDTVNIYENARRAGRINPAEAQRFNAMDARLQNLRAELSRDGFSLQECLSIGAAIHSERNEVIRMSRYDLATARCIADNRRAHYDVYAVYTNAQRAGRIRPDEARRFQAMENRLNGFQGDLKRDGLTLAECQAISRAIANERAVVEQMVVR